jgi:hypothetical protein
MERYDEVVRWRTSCSDTDAGFAPMSPLCVVSIGKELVFSFSSLYSHKPSLIAIVIPKLFGGVGVDKTKR